MRIIIIALVMCTAWHAHAAAQEEERVAPARALPKRGYLIGKGKTTTTTTAAPEEEPQYEEYVDESESQEPSSEAPTTSTEGKKLVGSGVRPFRSNTDLLESLKRRRAQAAEAKLHGYSSTAAPAVQDSQTEAPVKANFSKKRFNSGRDSEDSPPASKPTKSRFGRPAKSLPEPEPEQEQNDAAPPTRTARTFRRGGN